MASLAADFLLLLHLAFILFVALGAFLVLKWPRIAWLHIPCALWGMAIEFGGWICPLTPLEQHFLKLAGEAGYSGGFLEHYIWPLVYPDNLTRGMQVGLGLAVLVVNLLVYGIVLARHKRNSL
jgi:hypothetical protein